MSTSNGVAPLRGGKVNRTALIRQVYVERQDAGLSLVACDLLPIVRARMKDYPVGQRQEVKLNDIYQALAGLPRTASPPSPPPLPPAAPATPAAAEVGHDRLSGVLDEPSTGSTLIPELRLAARFLADMGGDPEKARDRLMEAAYIVGHARPA